MLCGADAAGEDGALGVVFGVDERIDSNQLSTAANGAQAPALERPAPGWPCPSEAPWTLRQLNRSYTEWVLAGAGGNKERAAETLGGDLSTLYRWQRGPKD